MSDPDILVSNEEQGNVSKITFFLNYLRSVRAVIFNSIKVLWLSLVNLNVRA